MNDILFLILAYLCGSIPFGLLIAKTQGYDDIRAYGSGNIGATNILRILGKKWGILTLICDILKGFIPVVLCKIYAPNITDISILFPVIGHIFPIWLKFKGGKGVATALGAFLGLSWVVGLICIIVWLICAKLSKISSLSALISIGSAPLWFFVLHIPPFGSFVIALLIFILHHANIKRLINGTEPKIGKKKAS
jgi:glycerol-3-phosphate acyltransferase PlsY